jgi:hypothetical protein
MDDRTASDPATNKCIHSHLCFTDSPSNLTVVHSDIIQAVAKPCWLQHWYQDNCICTLFIIKILSDKYRVILNWCHNLLCQVNTVSEPDARTSCVRMEAGVWCMVTRLSATVHLTSRDPNARSHKLVITHFIQLTPFLYYASPMPSHINTLSKSVNCYLNSEAKNF